MDSLWNLGRVEEGKKLLQTIPSTAALEFQLFRDGLQALLAGELNPAYDAFVAASKVQRDGNGDQTVENLRSVFTTERAVNVSTLFLDSRKIFHSIICNVARTDLSHRRLSSDCVLDGMFRENVGC